MYSPSQVIMALMCPAWLQSFAFSLIMNEGRKYRLLKEFLVRCIAHIVNLVVKDSLTLIRGKIDNISSMVSCLKSYVKRRDFKSKLNSTVALLSQA